MDIVYPLKNQPQNEELRYSLRSLENLPHDNVWLVGNMPRWAWKVSYIPTRQDCGKYINTIENINLACRQENISEDLIVMNDDFFILSPITEVPLYHRGYLEDTIRAWPLKGSYLEKMRTTLAILNREGIKRPKNYELHIPYVLNKKLRLDLMERFPPSLNYCPRTLYFNFYGFEGTYHEDVTKFRLGDTIIETDFLSTSDVFARLPDFKAFFSSRFPQQSPYEKYYG